MNHQETAPGAQNLFAVILVGGKGTRLGLKGLPKPMVELDEGPLLEKTLLSLVSQGITDIIFLAGHLSHVIEEHFGSGERFGCCIRTIVEEIPLGSAGAFCPLRQELTQDFLVVYGDVLFDVDIARFQEFHRNTGADATLYAHPNDHPFDSDLIECDERGSVLGFHPKPHDHQRHANLVNAALYLCRPTLLELIEDEKVPLDWGKDIFPSALAKGKSLFAYRGTEYLKDIGTPKRIAQGRKDYKSGRVANRNYARPQKAVFLDRDGVINAEIDGVYRPGDLELLEGAAQAIRHFNQSEYITICVTNQPGLAKGFVDLKTLKMVHAELDAQLAGFGAYLDDLLFCPHHPESGFDGEVAALKVDCTCRKPKPGLLQRAARSHNIDLGQSIMVGDHLRDLRAGHLAGCKKLFLINDGSHAPGVYQNIVGDYAEVKNLGEVRQALLEEA